MKKDVLIFVFVFKIVFSLILNHLILRVLVYRRVMH